MDRIPKQRVGWIEANWPAPQHLRALTTVRTFLGEGSAAGDANIRALTGWASFDSRERLRTATTGESGRLQWLRQVHGNQCIHATTARCAEVPEADAAWTDEVGLGLVVRTADCVPILITDRLGHCIGVAHGGWRGLVGGVVGRLVASINGGAPLLAWIGPAIGRDAYEVGGDLFDTLCSTFGRALTEAVCRPGPESGKWQLDLFTLTVRLLRAAGVNEVYGDRLCTFADPRFYSYRRNSTSGRMATVVWKTR